MSQKLSKKDNSVRSILRNTSILGGVQIFQILANVVRGKFVAIFLGPDGMGISSLFTSSAGTITQASSLGLNLAIVREVAQSADDRSRLASMMQLVVRVARATALLGALFTALFSGWLSNITFGSADYAWQFVLLAVFVYFTVAANAKAAVLQGMHLVKKMSRATIVGCTVGLCVGVPLYWWLGALGIVPAMVALSLSLYIFYWWQLRKYKSRETPSFRWRDNKAVLKRLLAMGMVLVAGDLIGKLAIYGLNLVIRMVGDLDQVGLYQAANSITAQYVGTIIAALSLDYFPRLSAASSDNRLMATIVNRQALLVVVAMTALSCLIIFTAPLLIRILLTEAFLPVTDLVRIFGAAIFFKVASFPVAYITFAKDNRRVFFLLEGILGNVLFFGCSAAGYWLAGLTGVGYAMIIENVVYMLLCLGVNYRLYAYLPSRRVLAEYAGGAVVCLMCMQAGCSLPAQQAALTTGLLTGVSAAYAICRIRTMLREDKTPSHKIS